MAELFNEKKLPLVAEVRDEFDRGRAHRHRAARAHGRSRAADGVAVQADRAREPHSAQHERADQGQGAQGDGPRRGAARVARPSPRGAGARAPSIRLAEIEHRLEVLGGLLVAYLNLDKVIKIIRNEDEPKPVLMKTFKLTDVQADAILNMRLRNLRKLEEMEIQRENKDLRGREGRDRRSCCAPRRSSGRRSPDRSRKCATTFGTEDAARQAPHRLCRSAGARRGRDRRSDGGARADHRRGVGEGLDPRAARPRERSVRRRVQVRRRAQVCVSGRNHVEEF